MVALFLRLYSIPILIIYTSKKRRYFFSIFRIILRLIIDQVKKNHMPCHSSLARVPMILEGTVPNTENQYKWQ